MYLKKLSKVIVGKQSLQELERLTTGKQSTEMSRLLSKLKGKDFWIWDKEQHKQEYTRTNKQCCFTHLIPGKLVKNGTQRPIYPWQKQIFDTILDESDNIQYYQRKHLAWLKARGIGGSSLITRIMAWLCCKDDKLRGQEMCIVTGNRIELSTFLITTMLKNLFQGLLPPTKETVAIINGVTITGYPALHASAIRGTSPIFCMADEASMWPTSYQQEVFDILQGLISKSDPYLVFLSSPNEERDLMSQIFKQEESICIYRRIRTDWTIGEDTGQGNIFSQNDLSRCRMSSSWDRELCLRFVNKRGNTFLPSWILKAQSYTYDPDFVNPDSSRIIAIDPAWSVEGSKFGILVSDFRDGRICICYEAEFSDAQHEEMVELVRDLYLKYYPVSAILVDGSQISWIKSLKIAMFNELHEDPDYLKAIQRFKDSKCDWTLIMRIRPVLFSDQTNKAMLSHLREILAGGYLMIDKRFDKLLMALHNCSDIEGKVDRKQAMAHSDIFDCCRMLTIEYQFT